jgi:hypothetical protein
MALHPRAGSPCSSTPSTAHISQSKRDAQIYNVLDNVALPSGWRLGLYIPKHGNRTPSISKLCKVVEAWAAKTAGDDPDLMPVEIFDVEGWSIELTLYGGYRTDVTPERVIAGAMSDMRLIRPHVEIRQAVEKKGSRYGAMSAPYLIVVADCKDELVGGEHIAEACLEAMLGTIVTQSTTDASNKQIFRDVRLRDGYWGTPQQPKHQNVSGVLVLPKAHLWDLRNEYWQPLLLRNPRADYPLPDKLFPISSYRAAEIGNLELVPGLMLADILGLPLIWPPEDAA